MNLWGYLNKIEEYTFKVDGVASVLKILAEQTNDNEHSGALWLCSDVLNERTEAISLEISAAMKVNKELTDRISELEAKLAKLMKGKKK